MKPGVSLSMIVCQSAPAPLGRTQADRVIPFVRSRSFASATVTQSLTPSKESAPPFWPVATRPHRRSCPCAPSPSHPPTIVPVPASNDVRGDEAGRRRRRAVVDRDRDRRRGRRVAGCVTRDGPERVLAGRRGVVSQEALYGALVSAAPRSAPSTVNWTLVTPTLSEAVACTVTVPETVAPPGGRRDGDGRRRRVDRDGRARLVRGRPDVTGRVFRGHPVEVGACRERVGVARTRRLRDPVGETPGTKPATVARWTL